MVWAIFLSFYNENFLILHYLCLKNELFVMKNLFAYCSAHCHQLLELDLRGVKWLGELEALTNSNSNLSEKTIIKAWVSASSFFGDKLLIVFIFRFSHFMISFSLFTLLSFQQWYLYIFNWLFRTLVVIQLLCQRLAVEILISGLVFNEEDFVRPWEGKIDNMERYRLYTTFHLLEISTLHFSFSISIIPEISWFSHILSL